MIDSNEFGNWMKHQREQRGISQRELTSLLGYKNPQFLCGIEKGSSTFPKEKLSKLSKVLNISKTEVAEAYVKDYKKQIKQILKGEE